MSEECPICLIDMAEPSGFSENAGEEDEKKKEGKVEGEKLEDDDERKKKTTTTTTHRMERCGHRFHAECAKEWIKSNDVCPLCRKGISRGDVSKLDVGGGGGGRSLRCDENSADWDDDEREAAAPLVPRPVGDSDLETWRRRLAAEEGRRRSRLLADDAAWRRRLAAAEALERDAWRVQQQQQQQQQRRRRRLLLLADEEDAAMHRLLYGTTTFPRHARRVGGGPEFYPGDGGFDALYPLSPYEYDGFYPPPPPPPMTYL